MYSGDSKVINVEYEYHTRAKADTNIIISSPDYFPLFKNDANNHNSLSIIFQKMQQDKVKSCLIDCFDDSSFDMSVFEKLHFFKTHVHRVFCKYCKVVYVDGESYMKHKSSCSGVAIPTYSNIKRSNNKGNKLPKHGASKGILLLLTLFLFLFIY